jgi:hypothetical protein
MPRLTRGAKWTYGWVIVGPEREIKIPPAAWDEYGFRRGGAAIFTPGSRKSGGFGIIGSASMAEAGQEPNRAYLRALGRSRFGDRRVIVPTDVGVAPGDQLLTVRGSRHALGFVARGPIYDEALKHTELESFE